VTRTTTTRLIAEQSPILNSRKRTMLALKLNLDPERSLWSCFLKKLIHLKAVAAEKTASSKKRTRKTESILSTEINLTTSSDEGEEYLFTSSKPFSFSKTKLTKSSHPITELVVILIVNN
jgi:hypothetical protein